MIPERMKELLPVMTAYANGATIQYCSKDTPWTDMFGEIRFDMHTAEYRVKPPEPPPPLEGWINRRTQRKDTGYVEIGSVVWPTKEKAAQYSIGSNLSPIYIREVTPDDLANCLSPYQVGKVTGENHKLRAALEEIKSMFGEIALTDVSREMRDIAREALKDNK